MNQRRTFAIWGALAVAILPLALKAQTIDARFAGGILQSAGVPNNGTSCVQTLTFGGTPTGGTFALAYGGLTTGPIVWSATNATLLANMQTALNNLGTVGPGGFTLAAGTLTNGIGTITATAGGNLNVSALPAMTVPNNSLTGTTPTLAVAITTVGVQADGRKAAKGALLIDPVNAVLYQNRGVPLAPNWAKVSSE